MNAPLTTLWSRRVPSSVVVTLALALCLFGCSRVTMDAAPSVAIRPFGQSGDLVLAYHGLQRPEEIEAWFRPILRAGTIVTKSDYEQFPVATQELVKALQKYPENAYAWLLLGLIFAVQRKPEVAVEATRESVRQLALMRERDPAAFRVVAGVYTFGLTALGLQFNYVGRYADALDSIRAIEPSTLEPNLRLLYYWTLTMTYAGLGRFRDATAALNESLKISDEELGPIPSSPPWCPRCNTKERRDAVLQYLLGLIALRRGDADAAEEHLRRAINIDSQLWDAHYLLAEALIHAGREEASRGVLNHLLRTLPPDGLYPLEVAYATLGAAEESGGRLAEAAIHYRKAGDLARERARRFRDRVVRGMMIDSSTRAGDLLSQSIDMARDGLPDVEMSLASIEVSFLASDSAAARYRRGLEIEDLYRRAGNNPTYERRHVAEALLAKYYWSERRHDDALDAMARSLRLRLDFWSIELFVQLPSPSDGNEATLAAVTMILDALYSLRVNLRESSGQMSRVIAKAKQQLEPLPEDLARARAMSKLYFLTNERSENERLLQAVATEHPGAVFAHVGLATLAVEDEQWDEARRRLDIILTSIASTPRAGADLADARDAYYLRGRVRLHNKDFTGARSDFSEALRIWPEWPPAKLAVLTLPDNR